MLRQRLAVAALAAGLGFSAGCASTCERDHPILDRLGLARRAEPRGCCETCGQVSEGPILEDNGSCCPAPFNGNGMNSTVIPQPGMQPLGPPPRLVPRPQPPDMPYAPPGSNGY
jgi:hypothetical protein